ncbi:MAG TPA: OB-fold nucleic acid binding domain-containing protein, partial [Bacteroidota bacterium]
GRKFENLFDFCRRADLRLVNKKTLESLIQAGAFDTTPGHRAQLYDCVEKAMQYGQSSRGLDLIGQSSLFEAAQSFTGSLRYPPLPEKDRWSEYEKLHREKTVLGFYVSGHPLAKYEDEVNAFSTVTLGSSEGAQAVQNVRACGIVSQVRRKIDRKGNTMAFITLEDFTGKGECIVFSDAYGKYERFLHLDSMVMVIGKGEAGGDALRIIVNEVYPMDRVREKFTKSIILSINVNDVRENTIIELRKLMERYRGNCSCYFSVLGGDLPKQVFHSKKFIVEPNDEFIAEVKRILGPNSIKLTA